MLDGPGMPAPSAHCDPSFDFRSGHARDRTDEYRETAVAACQGIDGGARVSDPSRALDPDARVPADWPRAGGVRFEGVRLRYERCGAPAGAAGVPEGAAGSAGVAGGAQAAVRGESSSAAEPAWALAGLDLELRPGERLGLVGRTGAPHNGSHLQVVNDAIEWRADGSRVITDMNLYLKGTCPCKLICAHALQPCVGIQEDAQCALA